MRRCCSMFRVQHAGVECRLLLVQMRVRLLSAKYPSLVCSIWCHMFCRAPGWPASLDLGAFSSSHKKHFIKLLLFWPFRRKFLKCFIFCPAVRFFYVTDSPFLRSRSADFMLSLYTSKTTSLHLLFPPLCKTHDCAVSEIWPKVIWLPSFNFWKRVMPSITSTSEA